MTDEIAEGVMAPLFSISDWEKIPNPKLLTCRFGVEQGSVEFDTHKIRPIDDYKASKLNEVTQLGFQVVLQDVRFLKELWSVTDNIPSFRENKRRLFKADQTGAYRQIPISQ
jgi:hypothetical protein